MRVLCHAQHLTGVGHAVLPSVIANELASEHDVYLVDGGRYVPRPAGPVEATRLRLPELRRAGDGGLTGERGEPGSEVLARRASILVQTVRSVLPDAVLVDHYPFSKWELATEIDALIDAARDANPRVRVVASVRDISPRTRYEVMTDDEYAERVFTLLERHFDALVVYSDPSFIPFEDYFPLTRAIPIPMTYSGFVAEPVPRDRPGNAAPYAVASTGGIDSPAFLAATITAFRMLVGSGPLGAMRLHVFAGLGAAADDLRTLENAAHGGPVDIHAFSGDFTAWLHGATLSISRCGYNTSVALLRSRIPAVVVPATGVSDQRFRAVRLADAGLAIAVDGAHESDVSALVRAIDAVTSAPRPEHALNLDGARGTRRFLESLVTSERDRG